MKFSQILVSIVSEFTIEHCEVSLWSHLLIIVEQIKLRVFIPIPHLVEQSFQSFHFRKVSPKWYVCSLKRIGEETSIWFIIVINYGINVNLDTKRKKDENINQSPFEGIQNIIYHESLFLNWYWKRKGYVNVSSYQFEHFSLAFIVNWT